MIKITLKNKVNIDCDSPKEASQFIRSLYWKEFQKNDKEEAHNISEVKEHKRKRRMHSLNKNCGKCARPLKGFSQHKIYCDECAKERKRIMQREFARKKYRILHPKKVEENVQEEIL